MEHLGSLESTQEARVALGYRLGQFLRFFRAFQTSRVLHNLTCDQASLYVFSRWEGTPDIITRLFVCRPLIKISVSENVGDAISPDIKE